MKRIQIVPYKMSSKSAKLLKEALCAKGYKAFRKIESNAPPKRGTLVIYYGGQHQLPGLGGLSMNRNREIATNKITTFQALTNNNLPTVPWTTEREIASEWLTQGKTVVARATTTGHTESIVTGKQIGRAHV